MHLMHSPVFSDAERTQAARLIQWAALGMVVAATLYCGLMLLLRLGYSARWLLTLGVIWVTALAVLFLVRSGRLYLARAVMFIFAWGVVTALCLTGGGLHAPAITGYLIVILVAGFLAGEKAGVVAGVWCSLSALVFLGIEQAGILPMSTVVDDSAALWLDFTTFAIVVTILQFVAVRLFSDALARALHELTARQKSDAALQEQAARYAALTATGWNGFWAVSRDGRIIDVNDVYCRMTGYSRAELLTLSVADINAAETRDDIGRRIERVIAAGAEDFATRHRCKDGRLINVEISTNFVPESQCFVSFIRDVTTRKHAEEQLLETRNQLAAILEGISDAVLVSDRGGGLSFVNTPAARLAGYDSVAAMRDNRLPDKLIEDFHFFDEAGAPLPVDQFPNRLVLRGIETQPMTIGYRRKGSADTRWLAVQSTPVRGADGQIKLAVAIAHDVTERKMAEARLRDDVRRGQVLLQLYEKAPELTEQELYAFVLEQAVELTDSTIGFFHRVSDDQKTIVLTAWYNGTPDDCQIPNRGHHLIEKAGNWLDCVRLKRPVVYNNFSISPNRRGLPDGHAPVQRLMSIPVLEGDKIALVFGVANKAKDYGDGDLINLQLVAAEVQKIIRQRRVDAALQHKTEEINRFFSISSDLFCVADNDGFLRMINPVWEQKFGYSRAELTERRYLEFVHPDDVSATRQAMAKLEAQQEVSSFINRYRCKDGAYRWLEWRSTPAGNLVYSSARDITERRHAELERERMLTQLRLNQEQLRVLSHRVLDVQETERRYIARELHDEIGQSLTALKLLLDGRDNAPGTMNPRLSDAQGVLCQLITSVRDLSLDLRPAMLDDLGLLPALLWYLERYTAQTRVVVSFHHSDVAKRRLGSAVETAAYRIVQEALTNVARHAGVDKATVRLWAHRTMLGLQVEENGKGFDVAAVMATGEAVGLSGMRERAALLNGELTIDSAPGAGTCVTAQLPLAESV